MSRALALIVIATVVAALPGRLAAEVRTDPVWQQAGEVEVANLLRRARAAIAAGEPAAARVPLERLRDLAPGDRRVIAAWRGWRQLAERTGPAAGADQPTAVREELAAVEFRVAVVRAERHLRRGEHRKALAAMSHARLLVGDLPEERREGVETDLDLLAHRIESAQLKEYYEEERGDRQRLQEAARIRVVVDRREEESRLSQRLARVIAMKQKGHIELALRHARQLVSDHPRRSEAEALFQMLLDQAHERRRLDTEARLRELEQEQSLRIHRAMIPEGFDGRPMYPEGWAERHLRPEGEELPDRISLPEWHEALLERLNTRLDLSFESVDAIQAIEMIAQRTGVSIVIANELRATGVPPVSLHATGMRLENVLDWITRMAGTQWKVLNGAIWIGSQETEEPILRLYDVAQVVYGPPDLPGPSINDLTLGGAGGGGGGFDVFGDVGDDVTGMAPEDLVDLITASIAPGLWGDPETGFSIQIRNSTELLINASPHVHLLVQEFIRSQERAFHTMVQINVRFLRIRDDFFEEIGVDWENAGMLRGEWGSAGADHQRDDGNVVSQIVNEIPGTAANIAPSLATSGLNLQAMYLGVTKVAAMLRAAEQKNRARVVQAIELTTLSGVQANAQRTGQLAFIGDYTVTTGGGDGSLDPQIDVLTFGTTLDVTPYVSADGKYVSLTVRPMFSTPTLGQDSIQALTGLADGVVGFTQFPIDLPNLEIFSAGTQVTVPDGGSILVGRFDTAIEQHNKAGVPFLSSIPFLGRLFGVRGNYSARENLYMLLRAQVILLEEEEGFL